MSSNPDRRADARAKAAAQREQHRRRTRRNRILLQAAVGALIVGAVGVISGVIATAGPPTSGSGPRNMANGGITLAGSGLAAVKTAPAPATATPTPQSSLDGKALIQVWEDFGCPACRAFEEDDASLLHQLVSSGAAEVEYLPVAILDRHFAAGDRYSTRAANAAAAVANWSPRTWLAFHDQLFRSGVQPAEGGPGLSDARLAQIAQQTGAAHLDEIRADIRSRRYEHWIAARTDEFNNTRGTLTGVHFPASREDAVTPTVLVNGVPWDGRTSTFGGFFISTAGATR